MTTKLYYVHDPMCSWCWAFRPAWNAIVADLPKNVHIQRLLGGLAPDTDEPMPEKMRHYLQNTWRTIQQHVAGTQFNFAFWEKNRPRRATYPACRAVIAARIQGTQYNDLMTYAIQRGYYLNAQNPSDPETLITLAIEIGVDKEQFSYDLNSTETQEVLQKEITFVRQLGINGFPSMILETNDKRRHIPVMYTDPQSTLNTIRDLINI